MDVWRAKRDLFFFSFVVVWKVQRMPSPKSEWVITDLIFVPCDVIKFFSRVSRRRTVRARVLFALKAYRKSILREESFFRYWFYLIAFRSFSSREVYVLSVEFQVILLSESSSRYPSRPRVAPSFRSPLEFPEERRADRLQPNRVTNLHTRALPHLTWESRESRRDRSWFQLWRFNWRISHFHWENVCYSS